VAPRAGVVGFSPIADPQRKLESFQAHRVLNTTPELEILLPVHNEAGSIEATIREIYSELSPQVTLRFVICEDGSTDGTQEILQRLAESLPMKLIFSEARKGYSRAVIDGMKVLQAPYLLCLDSDGQCDPGDFAPLWKARAASDLVVGWRVNRADVLLRKLMSRTFYHIFQLFYRVPLHDPSCPYVLVRKNAVDQLLGELGAMQQGFWWEFVARAHRRGFSIQEFPVNHRTRICGATQVYKFRRLPGIGWRHFLALWRIWLQTRHRSTGRAHGANSSQPVPGQTESRAHESGTG
jgi:dolichol-phosphate mannosyltransferase